MMSQFLPIADARFRGLGISADSGCPGCFWQSVGVPVVRVQVGAHFVGVPVAGLPGYNNPAC